MTRPPFPSVWDSTMVGAFRACPVKAKYSMVEHWKPKGTSVHLHAGACFAHGLEVTRRAFYIEHRSAEDSVALGVNACFSQYGSFECPPDSGKSAVRTAGALEYYFSTYPLGTDPAIPAQLGDRLGIEFSFAVPLLDVLHPVSGDPIIYCGRADMIADFAGARYICDEKTTSALGSTWARKWDMRSQFTGYCYAAAEHGYPCSGVLVRGIAILKTKYDCAQAITYRPDWQIKRWREQVARDIERAKVMWESGVWDYNLDSACTEYGGCDFLQCCTSPDPGPWLETYFERRKWDPLSRTETLLVEGEM